MANHTITNTGVRNVEIMKIMRRKYNEDGAARAAAANPPEVFTPVTVDQFVQLTFESWRNSWKRAYADEIDDALAAPEMGALQAAKAAVRAKAGAADAD